MSQFKPGDIVRYIGYSAIDKFKNYKVISTYRSAMNVDCVRVGEIGDTEPLSMTAIDGRYGFIEDELELVLSSQPTPVQDEEFLEVIREHKRLLEI